MDKNTYNQIKYLISVLLCKSMRGEPNILLTAEFSIIK